MHALCFVSSSSRQDSLAESLTLLTVHAFSTQAAISPKLHVLVEALQQISVRWPIADRYLELVRRAVGKLDVSRNNDTFQAASLPLAISILLDIRKTAYEAVLQPSFTPDQTMSIVQDWLHEPLFDNFSWADPTWAACVHSSLIPFTADSSLQSRYEHACVKCETL